MEPCSTDSNAGPMVGPRLLKLERELLLLHALLNVLPKGNPAFAALSLGVRYVGVSLLHRQVGPTNQIQLRRRRAPSNRVGFELRKIEPDGVRRVLVEPVDDLSVIVRDLFSYPNPNHRIVRCRIRDEFGQVIVIGAAKLVLDDNYPLFIAYEVGDDVAGKVGPF